VSGKNNPGKREGESLQRDQRFTQRIRKGEGSKSSIGWAIHNFDSEKSQKPKKKKGRAHNEVGGGEAAMSIE